MKLRKEPAVQQFAVVVGEGRGKFYPLERFVVGGWHHHLSPSLRD